MALSRPTDSRPDRFRYLQYDQLYCYTFYPANSRLLHIMKCTCCGADILPDKELENTIRRVTDPEQIVQHRSFFLLLCICKSGSFYHIPIHRKMIRKN